MTLIVADTGPVNYLIQIGCVDVLPKLVKAVVLPASVVHELQSEGAPDAVREWAGELPDWIEVRKPAAMIPAQPELSQADRAAVSLAKELQALLLMDDRRARRAASDHAVETIGTLGILEVAARRDSSRYPRCSINCGRQACSSPKNWSPKPSNATRRDDREHRIGNVDLSA